MLPSFWCLEFPGVSSVISFSEAHPPGRCEGPTCAPTGPAQPSMQGSRAPAGPQEALHQRLCCSLPAGAGLLSWGPRSSCFFAKRPGGAVPSWHHRERDTPVARSLTRGTGRGLRPWPRSLRHPPPHCCLCAQLAWLDPNCVARVVWTPSAPSN